MKITNMIRKNVAAINICLSLLLFLGTNIIHAQENPTMQAQQALEEFMIDWNRADLQAIQEHLSFPHISHGGNGLIVAQSKGKFVQDFDLLKSRGWRRSSFDKFMPLQASENKVNFLVDYSRYDEADNVLSKGQVFYVVTKQDGSWGMQYRSGGPPANQLSEAVLDLNRQEATTAIYNFFAAFNAADNEALFGVSHVPQIMINGDFYAYAEEKSAGIVAMNFDGMRSREDWSHSTAENINAVHVMPNKVIFELEFERYNTAGDKYRIVPALWVLTKKSGKWGVEFRSLMAATFQL